MNWLERQLAITRLQDESWLTPSESRAFRGLVDDLDVYSLVNVVGPAGSGKSFIARTLVGRSPTEWDWGDPTGTKPYLAIDGLHIIARPRQYITSTRRTCVLFTTAPAATRDARLIRLEVTPEDVHRAAHALSLNHIAPLNEDSDNYWHLLGAWDE